MQLAVNVSENVHWIGVNDRRTHLFENLWPLENGVSYNSYLIVDEKTALLDTIEASKSDELLDKIKSILGSRKLDYLVINHIEPDHSGAIRAVQRQYPDVQFVGNRMTFALLKNYYGITENLIEVKDNQSIELGSRSLTFRLTPWVHWPETMMTFESKDQILFSGDAFGSFGTLDGGIFDDEVNLEFYKDEMIRYFSNIVGKFCSKVQSAMKKLDDLDIKVIAPTHGLVWRSQPQIVLDYYRNWAAYKTQPGALIVYGSMYGNTERMADVIARRLAERGIKNIRIYDASKTHISYILRDIWKYKAVVLGSCAYNGGVFPQIENLLNKIRHTEIKDHLLGLFGSSGWNGAGVKELRLFAKEYAWELIPDSISVKGTPASSDFEKCIKMADQLATRLKQQP